MSPTTSMELCRAVEEILTEFRPVFHRAATYRWFQVVAWAMMLRLDTAGVTSIVRCMGLAPSCYFNLLNFFHSSAFSVKQLCATWQKIAFSRAVPVTIGNRQVCVVDGIKVGKAGRRMPGVKLLHQESDDNTKPEYIMGHYWGVVSLLSCALGTTVAIPLRCQIQDGLKRSPSEVSTLVDKMIALIIEVLGTTRALVVGDAYFSTQKTVVRLKAAGLAYIGRMKISTVAFQEPLPEAPRRGRPRKRGSKVRLRELFDEPQDLAPATLLVYEKKQEVRYLFRDLLWQGELVRFVLSILPNGSKAILMCTDLAITPTAIIEVYARRQKIEVSFNALVHTLCGFGYHFWMRAMPKRRRGSGNAYLHRAGEAFRRAVQRKLGAYETFVNIASIVLGILQILAITKTAAVWDRFPVWLRTLTRHGVPTEHVVRLTLQHDLHQTFLNRSRSLQPLQIQQILEGTAGRRSTGHPIQIAA